MKYLYFFICILTINVFAYEYKSIEISENKKNLSNEIYWILQRDHFQDSIDKTDFNKKYIQAIIEKLDKNRSYFTINEVNDFLEKSSRRNDNDFDIELGYDLINLYFKKLIQFSQYQIELVQEDSFDFNKDEYLDIFYEDNQWALSSDSLKEVWRLETKNDLLIARTSDSSSSEPNGDLIKRYENIEYCFVKLSLKLSFK